LRVLGLDLGTKRIGVALSNSERTVATPYAVISRANSTQDQHEQILKIVNEWEVTTLIVGMPIALDGTLGTAANKAKSEIAELQKIVNIEIIAVDERFTTVTAEQVLREQNVSTKKGRGVVDKIAASIILQTWLDMQRGPEPICTTESNNE
tara:strand:- start:544 stop:996 length:453 start_codon:yes stop_codon:yes gene_type:complete